MSNPAWGHGLRVGLKIGRAAGPIGAAIGAFAGLVVGGLIGYGLKRTVEKMATGRRR